MHVPRPLKPVDTTTTTTVLRPFFQDYPGEPVPEENLWTSWCKGRLTEADTPTIQLGATPSGLSSAHLHHPPHFFTGQMPFLPPSQQCQSTEACRYESSTCIVEFLVYLWRTVWSDAEDSRGAWCTATSHAGQRPKGWPVLRSTTRWIICAEEVERGKSGMKLSRVNVFICVLCCIRYWHCRAGVKGVWHPLPSGVAGSGKNGPVVITAWLGSSLWVPFSTSMLFVGWRDPANSAIYPKVLFRKPNWKMAVKMELMVVIFRNMLKKKSQGDQLNPCGVCGCCVVWLVILLVLFIQH